MDEKKRKLNVKRIVFLILAVFFGLGIVLALTAFIRDPEGPTPVTMLLLVYSPASALFLRLFLRKEKQKVIGDAETDDVIRIWVILIKLLLVAMVNVAIEISRNFAPFPLQVLLCVFEVALIFWLILGKKKAK